MYCLYLFFQLYSHAYLFEEENDEGEEEEAKMGLWSALTALLVVTVVTAFCADYLVGSIDEFASNAGIPKVRPAIHLGSKKRQALSIVVVVCSRLLDLYCCRLSAMLRNTSPASGWRQKARWSSRCVHVFDHDRV